MLLQVLLNGIACVLIHVFPHVLLLHSHTESGALPLHGLTRDLHLANNTRMWIPKSIVKPAGVASKCRTIVTLIQVLPSP